MDTALELRSLFDKGEPLGDAQEKLQQSPLVQRLTSAFEPKPLYAIWRIIALSEIPTAAFLDYKKK